MHDHNRVVLVLGAGSNLGTAVASKFMGMGYRVALVARSVVTGVLEHDMLSIQSDLSDPQAVPRVFKDTTDCFGPPNVVIYNGERSPRQ